MRQNEGFLKTLLPNGEQKLNRSKRQSLITGVGPQRDTPRRPFLSIAGRLGSSSRAHDGVGQVFRSSAPNYLPLLCEGHAPT